MKVIEIILEVLGWLAIVAGVTILTGLVALLVYIKWDSRSGVITAISIVSVGFILGAIWATRIWIKHGTMAWLSGIRRIS